MTKYRIHYIHLMHIDVEAESEKEAEKIAAMTPTDELRSDGWDKGDKTETIEVKNGKNNNL